MPADPRITDLVASTMCDAMVDSYDTGGPAAFLIYDGTIPTDADTAIGAQVKLAECTFAATAFGAAAAGVATANAIVSDSAADATGTAAWFTNTNAAETTRFLDGTVGTSGEDLNLNSTAIAIGATVDITAMTVTMPKT